MQVGQEPIQGEAQPAPQLRAVILEHSPEGGEEDALLHELEEATYLKLLPSTGKRQREVIPHSPTGLRGVDQGIDRSRRENVPLALGRIVLQATEEVQAPTGDSRRSP